MKSKTPPKQKPRYIGDEVTTYLLGRYSPHAKHDKKFLARANFYLDARDAARLRELAKGVRGKLKAWTLKAARAVETGDPVAIANALTPFRLGLRLFYECSGDFISHLNCYIAEIEASAGITRPAIKKGAKP